jgi:hypothetical protein
MAEKFEQWAVVELFGHQVIAGMVSEQVIGGQGFVRVDVPAVNSNAAFTKFYGAGAIYAISPCDEAAVMGAVARIQPKPIQMFVYARLLPMSDDDEVM